MCQTLSCQDTIIVKHGALEKADPILPNSIVFAIIYIIYIYIQLNKQVVLPVTDLSCHSVDILEPELLAM